MRPEDPVARHFKLDAVHQKALRRLGIATIHDLLYHLPTRFEEAGSESNTATLVPGSKVTLYGTIEKLKAKKLWKSRRAATEGVLRDVSGSVRLLWFNQPYIASYHHDGEQVRLTGVVGGSAEKPYIANPAIEPLRGEASRDAGLFKQDETAAAPALAAVYPETAGVTSVWFHHALKRVLLSGVLRTIEDPIPPEVRARYHLPDIETAFTYLHAPEKIAHAEAARKRFAFEEIFAIQTAQAQERAANDTLAAFPIPDAHERVDAFLSHMPYSPTRAQRDAIRDIVGDFEGRHPMARLLEGDVGSGKTLVAAASAYAVVHARPPGRSSGTLQVAYMAPTEILAEQHFSSFISYFKDLPIAIGLITGSGCKKFPSKVSRDSATAISRSQLLKWVASGEIAMLIGTHALIQKSVAFKHLAYVIVDEQHRFGTRQRRELAKKNSGADADTARGGVPAPHFLSMTATPIPRTLALTMYGDLDLSVLDERPVGRAVTKTAIVAKDRRKDAYDAVREELRKGHQAYVICPRIEEPDPRKLNAVMAKSAKAEAKRLQTDVFPEYSVGLLHGAMTPGEKDAVMQAFSQGEISVLVATSVVEVGINVPNATAIIIEGAERFGLAQLHQLRGRIMRSSAPSVCFLLPESAGAVAMKRLRVLEKSSDGFKLAEADLETRGMGDLYGRRQWGVSDIGMEALKNVRLIKAARDEADQLVRKDPALSGNRALAARVAHARRALHTE